MSDPIEDAFKSLHQGNLLAAKDARIKQLEERLEAMREAGDGLQKAFLRLTSGTSNWDGKLYWNWKAAKEGKANG
jgi:hypothetical protein